MVNQSSTIKSKKKEMKKIFYFIASAIVALGAVACQNDINEGVTPEQEGFSINVTIADQTRVALGNLDEETKQRKLTFTEGDVLVVREEFQKGTNYFFTYTKSEGDVYTFTCEQEGVNSLVGKTPYVFYLGGLHEQANDLTIFGAICNTAAENVSGIGMYANSGKFGDENCTISLETLPVLKFTAQEAVTISSEDHTSLFFVNGSWANTYTTTTIGEIYLPVIGSSGTDCTVTVTTESGFKKSFTETLDLGIIYNLGTIEKPAPKTYKVYVIAQPKSAQAAWTKVNVYTWDIDPLTAWPGTDITNNKEIINGYTYNYLEYPATWTGKNVNVIINNGSAQTPDIELGKLDKNYYVVYNDAGTVYTEAPAAGSIKEAATTPSSKWALAGDFNSWGEKAMEVVAGETKLFVAKSVDIGAYKEIKVKEKGNWNNSYGGGINYLNQNIWTKVYSGGSNFSVVNAGTYDVYFDEANTRLYLMIAGTDYKTAKEQSTNGAAPDLSGASWGLCGAHNNWNSPDIKLEWDGTISLYVAKNAKLTGEFKVRANNSWGEDYGCGGTITVNASAGRAMTRGGGNCKVASGTYDVYFDFAGKKIWVKTPGSAAPAK